jgi:predicted HicB family RNase H-like nuclease
MPLETWQRVGQQLSVIVDASCWWIGDWLIFGRRRYPDRYRRAIEETALGYQTLRNYAWIAAKFNVSRRRDKLGFQHHVEVATLAPDDQDFWLSQAEQHDWSRNELRARLRGSRTSLREPQNLCSEGQVQVWVSTARLERWERAAAISGTSLLDWITRVLDYACDELSDKSIVTQVTPRATASDGVGT